MTINHVKFTFTQGLELIAKVGAENLGLLLDTFHLGPYTLGHERGGEIADIGSGVTTLNTHHFPFEKIHEAFDLAVHDKENAFKVMLTF